MLANLFLAMTQIAALGQAPEHSFSHEDLARVAIAAEYNYSSALLAHQGKVRAESLNIMGNAPSSGNQSVNKTFVVANNYSSGRMSLSLSRGFLGGSMLAQVSLITKVSSPVSDYLQDASTNSTQQRQARLFAFSTIVRELGPWSCDPILTENNIIFEKDGVSVAGSISLQAEYGRLTNITISWPPTDFEPFSWPAVSAEEVKANLRKLVAINPENQTLRLEFRFGYPLVFQESLGNLTEKELASRMHGLPHWVASIYTRTSHGSIRLEQYTFSSLTGELLSGPVPFLGSIETQSLLPGIYTLPNGWKATLSPAEPPQSTTWQPTTLKSPNGDTIKAEADPNFRFYKIKGTTYLRSRIPG